MQNLYIYIYKISAAGRTCNDQKEAYNKVKQLHAADQKNILEYKRGVEPL